MLKGQLLAPDVQPVLFSAGRLGCVPCIGSSFKFPFSFFPFLLLAVFPAHFVITSALFKFSFSPSPTLSSNSSYQVKLS